MTDFLYKSAKRKKVRKWQFTKDNQKKRSATMFGE